MRYIKKIRELQLIIPCCLLSEESAMAGKNKTKLECVMYSIALREECDSIGIVYMDGKNITKLESATCISLLSEKKILLVLYIGRKERNKEANLEVIRSGLVGSPMGPITIFKSKQVA